MRTPGPWTLKTQAYPVPFNSFTIKGPDGRSIVACASSVKRGPAEKKSNAQLIVDAPGLLASLESYVLADGLSICLLTKADRQRLDKAKKLIERVNADFTCRTKGL